MATGSNLYLIKDLARLSGHSTHTIKYYLKLGLITESGRSPQTRFRYFTDETVERLSSIRQLQKQQRTLTEIKQLLIGGSRLQAEGSRELPPSAWSLQP